MKKLLFTLALLFSVAVASAQVTFDTSSTLKALMTKSAEEEKLIFVDCYATWCGPCKYMDSNVFSNKNVGEYMNNNFINAKYDMESGEGLIVARRYMIKSYPTFLILNKKGEEVARLVGSSGADEFIDRVQQALKK
ncbi:MAG: thioredoxin family protein [Rikenellaceae bacterium]